MANDNETALIQELSWQEVREQVRNVDKVLADLIDRLSPSENLKLLQATYSFGDLILKDGKSS